LKSLYAVRIKPAILRQSVPINNLNMDEAKAAIEHVALISANGDLEIAKSVAEAVKGVGEDGICIAEEGAGNETSVSFDRGFSFNSGLADLGGSAGPSFVNRNDLGDCMVEGAYVCLYDGEVNDIGTIVPILQRVGSEVDSAGRSIKSPLIVFAHRFSDQVLKMMAQNFRRGTLTVVPVMTARNGQANGRSQFLHDMAAYTGGAVFDAQGAPLTEAQLPQLGFCETLKMGRSEGVIIGEPDQVLVESRISDLKKQMEGSSEFDQDLIRYRIGRLTGGIATIYAGGKSQLEAKERHARVTDAICAVRSALMGGVVPGGGCTLASIARGMDHETGPSQIFAMALLAPFNQILENAGIDCVNIDEDIGPKDNTFMVYDALERDSVDWWTSGIMDPTKVTISALENALSVAQLLMTLGGAIVIQKTDGEHQVKAMQEGLLKAIESEALA
jgi:chaperonin GroEL